MRLRSGSRTAGVLLVALLATSCVGGSGPDEDGTRLRGARIEVLAVWSGPEQEAFEAVLRGFERRTGATVAYTSAGHGVGTALDARLAEGRPPDVAFLPQPGLLRRYAVEGRLVPLDDPREDIAGDLVERNYGAVWQRLGSEGGRLYGVWFKAATKSLIWYNVGAFERVGVVPPEDLEGLAHVARELTNAGVPAFSVGGADGWTLTDWFENAYLRLAGPARYERLAQHSLSWTDESVKDTLHFLARVLDPSLLAGGVAAALATGFEASVQRVFSAPPEAAMTFEGDFVAGVIRGKTRARIGIDADVFPFPQVGSPASAPAVVGGGDAAVLLRHSPAGAAFLRYLTTPEAASYWAARGGFLSPNRNVDLSVYPDDLSRSLARSVLEAGDDFRFDLSDLTPPGFGGTEGRGMRGALQDFLRTRDVDATAARLEADAVVAFGR